MNSVTKKPVLHTQDFSYTSSDDVRSRSYILQQYHTKGRLLWGLFGCSMFIYCAEPSHWDAEQYVLLPFHIRKTVLLAWFSPVSNYCKVLWCRDPKLETWYRGASRFVISKWFCKNVSKIWIHKSKGIGAIWKRIIRYCQVHSKPHTFVTVHCFLTITC